MPDYITTYTGEHLYPQNPEPEKIHIEDIAHALSYICRGNGHLSTFFSVGQHCIYCAMEAEARGYSGRIMMACLLHDASECYLSDVPRPVKKNLTGYAELEEKLLKVIFEKYLGEELSEKEKALVKEIDDDLLYFDLKELLHHETGEEQPDVRIDIRYGTMSFEEVESRYLELFERCLNRMKRE